MRAAPRFGDFDAPALVVRTKADFAELDQLSTFTAETTRLTENVLRRRTEATRVPAPSPVKKRPRRSSTSAIDTSTIHLEDDLYELDVDEGESGNTPTTQPQKKAVRPSDPALSYWSQSCRDAYLRALFWHDGRGNSSDDACSICAVPGRQGRYRCEDCCSNILTCKECCVAAHSRLPFHNIKKWENNFFSTIPLKALGLRIQLGHGCVAAACPSPVPACDEFVVIHTNGIHVVAVDFCDCDGHEPHYLQLLRSRLFPATVKRPESCATFCCLDQFQLASLQAGTTAQNFYTILELSTNAVGFKPPDRYRAFLRMSREYRSLLMLKRAGSGVQPAHLQALICPRIGWSAAPEDQCIYTQFTATDACFALKRRLISSEARDPALSCGWSYMVEPGPYREYLRTTTNKQEMSTCSGLAALEQANTKFSKGYVATGVGMVVCARHEFVLPNAVGDLQKGERYSNMDYIYASALRHLHRLLRLMASYDIVCQWCKKLFERLAKLPVLLHILGHTTDCKAKYNLNYVPGSGQTDAEGIERAWAGSRADGSKHETDGSGGKLVGLPALLRRRLGNAIEERNRQMDEFEVFSAAQADSVPDWRQMVLDYEADGSKKYPYATEGCRKPKLDWRFESRRPKMRLQVGLLRVDMK
ncbi:CxC2 domain-containing protein [Mycena chlorophos]|uniref:CxC2 domain-containing protein n=1 Tax=Mycena chlorophos TaxID=658473 RepID=A0A8H6RWJ4_MYCCL|nr:CxC2 domain-containing protein [Mycena chlorophos]